MPKIAHISDLHLQSGVPARQAQVEPILTQIKERDPYLVVISGDVTDDGWDSIDELKWSKNWLHERIGYKAFAQPGNHDVGNFASLHEGTVSQHRFEQWGNVYDPPTLPVNFAYQDNWIIIGINSMVFGSGLDAEKVALDRLERELAFPEKHDLHLAVFMHSPLFVHQSDEPIDPDTEYWLGPCDARRKVWMRLKQAGVKLIASGHVHQTRLTEVDGVKIAWAPPASGTWVHAPGLPNPPMPEQTGFFLHTLHDNGRVESELVECAPMLKLYEHNPA